MASPTQIPSLKSGAAKPSREWGIAGIGVWVAVILLAAVGLPGIGVVRQLVQGLSHPNSTPVSETPVFAWEAVWNTILYTLAIGVLATVMALPAAWAMRRRGAFWAALVAVPLLLPSYMAYAAWGMLRGPGSWLGDWLAHGSPARSLVFDRALAVWGLAMWVWPIGAFVVGAAAKRIPMHLLEALDLEPAARWRKWRVVAGMLAGSIRASVGLIALVMAGSAVPLHLAQTETYGVHIWKYLAATSDAGAVWPGTAPLLLLAGLGAVVLTRAAGREGVAIADEGAPVERRGGRMTAAAAWAVWGLSVVVPMLLFLMHLRHWSSLWTFWETSGAAVWSSGRNGAIVGAIAAGLALGMWGVRACRSRRAVGVGGWATGFVLWALLASALVPGVLVGAATWAFWNAPFMPRSAGDTLWPVVLSHVARFGFVGALAGWRLAALETPDERGARQMLAGNGVRAWWTLCVWPQAGAVVGVMLAVGALSLHEIESTIQLQPAGMPSLAQYVLDKLHYNRNEELCAACVNLTGVGIVLAGDAACLLGRLTLGRGGRSAPARADGRS